MEETINITTLNRYGDDICLIGYTPGGEIKVFYGVTKLLSGIQIGLDDTVKIEYRQEENKSKEIIKIVEWRINKVNKKLIKIIDECMEENQRKVRELNSLLEKYELSENGIKNAKEKASAELKQFIESRITEVEKLLEQAVKQLDAEEQKEIDRKNSSLEYQQLLSVKAGILWRIDISKVPADGLREYLKEFENYPIGIEILQNCAINNNSSTSLEVVNILPDNNIGERQERMKKAKAEIISMLNEFLNFDVRRNVSLKAIADSCKEYLQYQTEDFSLPTEKVWELMKVHGSENIYEGVELWQTA